MGAVPMKNGWHNLLLARHLNAVAGDLSLCLPKRQLDNIVETLHALDKVAPGTANYDTLLYGIECKYYSARPESEEFMLVGTKNIYALGDGAGFTVLFPRQPPMVFTWRIIFLENNKTLHNKKGVCI